VQERGLQQDLFTLLRFTIGKCACFCSVEGQEISLVTGRAIAKASELSVSTGISGQVFSAGFENRYRSKMEMDLKAPENRFQRFYCRGHVCMQGIFA
jgi:hypothetical protein